MIYVYRCVKIDIRNRNPDQKINLEMYDKYMQTYLKIENIHKYRKIKIYIIHNASNTVYKVL